MLSHFVYCLAANCVMQMAGYPSTPISKSIGHVGRRRPADRVGPASWGAASPCPAERSSRSSLSMKIWYSSQRTLVGTHPERRRPRPSCCGRSLFLRFFSPGGLPIVKRPPGMGVMEKAPSVPRDELRVGLHLPPRSRPATPARRPPRPTLRHVRVHRLRARAGAAPAARITR